MSITTAPMKPSATSFQTTNETSNRLAPNSSYTVGQLNGPHPWSITPPFGRDLVTVIASKAPLFATAKA